MAQQHHPRALVNSAQGSLQGIHYLCLIREGPLSRSAAPSLTCNKREQSRGGGSVCTVNTFLLSPKSQGPPGDRTAPGAPALPLLVPTEQRVQNLLGQGRAGQSRPPSLPQGAESAGLC